MSAPVRFLLGILQAACAIPIVVMGSVMSVFPVTGMLGRALMKPGMALAWNGGANIGGAIGIGIRKGIDAARGDGAKVASQSPQNYHQQ